MPLILPFKCGFFLCMNFENLVVSHSRCARGSENISSPLKQVGPSSSLAVPVQRASKVARPALQLQHTTHMAESKTNVINGQRIKKSSLHCFVCVFIGIGAFLVRSSETNRIGSWTQRVGCDFHEIKLWVANAASRVKTHLQRPIRIYRAGLI